MTVVRAACLAAACLPLVAASAGAVPFPQADRDRDGLVTFAEAKRAMPGLKEIHFGKCDPNGDGVIDRGEYPLLRNFYWMIYVDR